MPKNIKVGLGFFNIHSVAKYQKIVDPFGDIKRLSKEFQSAEKFERGRFSLVQSVLYATLTKGTTFVVKFPGANGTIWPLKIL